MRGESMMEWIKRAAAASALATAMLLVLLPAAAGSKPPQAGTGPFAGIFAWGTGAQKCNETQLLRPPVLTFNCHGIERNFAGSYVLIRFPNKHFNALVRTGPDQDPKPGRQWTEQDTAVLTPLVTKRGVIQAKEAVTLAGDSVTHSVDWDLGLDAWPFQSNGPRVVNAQITITPR